MALTGFPKAFGVWYRQLDRFDPASFERIFWHWPKAVMVPIKSVLKLRKEKVDRKEFSFVDLQPITIHFDGSIDRRKVDQGRDYTMDLFFAHPGDIIVAKIDLKNGAVGLAPDWENMVVTNHFAIYEPDRSKLLPEYFLRLIQTGFFKAYLWRNKVGAEGRKEVKLEFFESIEIPLPPLDVQRAIVARWQEAQESVREAEEQVKQIEASADERFFYLLGLQPPKLSQKPRVFASHFRYSERWSVSYSQGRLSGVDIEHGKYPAVELGSILSMVQYGTSEKANTEENGTPVIRMNNIVDGILDLSKLKHIRLPKQELQRLLLCEGDILFNRTNSKELVGKCAVFHEQGDYVFASYLIRVRTENTKAHPDYVASIINSRIGRQQIDALSRQIIGQANVNSVELRSLQIPLPPLSTQQVIVESDQAARSAIARQRERAARIRREAEAEVEALILGTKTVELIEGR